MPVQLFKADFELLRTDSLGRTRWSKTYSCGYGYTDRCTNAISTCNGGFALVGEADSCFAANGTGRGVQLIVTDSAGNVQWDRCYPLGGDGRGGSCSFLQQLKDGRFMLAGYGAAPRSAWLLCLTQTGEEIWFHHYPISTEQKWIWCSGAVRCTDGGYLLYGGSEDSAAAQTAVGRMDSWLLRTDSLGHRQWLRMLLHGDLTALQSIAMAADGRTVGVGFRSNGDYLHQLTSDGWMVTLSGAGEVVSERIFHETTNSWFTSITSQPDGRFLVAEWVGVNSLLPSDSSEFVLRRMDAEGNTLWSHSYQNGSSEVLLTLDDGYLMCSYGHVRRDSIRQVILKTDLSGAEKWRREYGVESGQQPLMIAGSCPGGYFFAGTRRDYSKSTFDGRE